ncbi:MAG TPA: cytochrome c oxidase subunit 3, partial [Thiobacillus sp.]
MSLAQTDKYYLPQPSLWPIIGSVALLTMAVGGVMTMHEIHNGGWVLLAGVAVLFFMMFGWFGEVIRDSEAGRYNKQVDSSFRWSMSWFIFSEVVVHPAALGIEIFRDPGVYPAFFGALFYTRVLSVPWLGESDTMAQLWPAFKATWPTAGPGLAAEGYQ